MTVNDEVRETEGSGHGLVKVPTLFLPRVTGKNMENLTQVAGLRHEN
jgi:hypothetical protein